MNHLNKLALLLVFFGIGVLFSHSGERYDAKYISLGSNLVVAGGIVAVLWLFFFLGKNNDL